jgi:hypothetical protein
MAVVPSTDWALELLSPDRLRKYLRAAGGNTERMFALYEWNLELAHALLRELCHVEVSLRNAIDGALAKHPLTLMHQAEWYLPATTQKLFAPHPVTVYGKRRDKNSTPRRNIEDAVRRAGPGAPHGKVIAEFTFGFWTYLTDDLHEKTLWVPALHQAFVPGTQRKALHATLSSVRETRNRVAHHESVFDHDPIGAHRRILSIAQRIDPRLGAYLRATATMESIWERRPR